MSKNVQHIIFFTALALIVVVAVVLDLDSIYGEPHEEPCIAIEELID